MARTSQLLHPQREPAPTRPAATVLLLRDGEAGLEVLMTRRSLTASFAPGAYVFPGGGIDALDAASHAQALRRPTQSDLHLTQAIAAIRESFEELGILLAYDAQGLPVSAAQVAQLDRHAKAGEAAADDQDLLRFNRFARVIRHRRVPLLFDNARCQSKL